MSDHLPEYHSPLKALGKKAALYVGLPILLIAWALYSMATYESPEKAEQRRALNKFHEEMQETLAKTEAIKAENARLRRAQGR